MAAFTIAGERVVLDHDTVEARLAGVLPDPIQEHYVVVGGRRFPPKQVISEITGLDRSDFTTHQARRILRRLGFFAARKEPRAEPLAADPSSGLPFGGRQAAALEPHIGKWVALGEPDEVLVAADTIEEVFAWLVRHEQRTSGVFRVPRSVEETEFVGPY